MDTAIPETTLLECTLNPKTLYSGIFNVTEDVPSISFFYKIEAVEVWEEF